MNIPEGCYAGRYRDAMKRTSRQNCWIVPETLALICLKF